jgi:hypothetical protein
MDACKKKEDFFVHMHTKEREREGKKKMRKEQEGDRCVRIRKKTTAYCQSD